MPLALAAALGLVSWVPRAQQSANLAWSVRLAAVALLVFQVFVFVRASHRGQGRRLLFTGARAQHYGQALVQLSVFAYWGYYWRPVYEYAWLLVAQVLFAYSFDMLLGWSRRDHYIVGFGPFPIIFSTNLFLWFRDDWYFLQFVMIAVGFLGKEFVRWHRDGRLAHIFNPSAFSLGLFSLALMATRTTDLTWGQDIATTLSLAPWIYLFLFSTGLIVMYAFSITLVAASAAAVLFGLSALYAGLTGVPYFVDSEVPTAVFLGLHLLVTDPSTSARTPVGRTIFGGLYGFGVFALYALLGAIGAPTFYDKLLCVPLLNLSVQRIDRLAIAVQESRLVRRWRLDRPFSAPNAAHMAVWMIFFAVMTARGATDGRHPGDSVPFWQQACAEGRRTACARLLQIESSYCADGSGWACNEVGSHWADSHFLDSNRDLALSSFSRACELRFQAACFNLLNPEGVLRAAPRIFDLRLLLREGGPNLLTVPEGDLLVRACAHGWAFACARTAGHR